ncbi:MAG: nuclear transport factor 2 family protein [Bacteroidetes bacterium]|nr:nuclear transport factor 2 family protein [Bacteroidota bacterium]
MKYIFRFIPVLALFLLSFSPDQTKSDEEQIKQVVNSFMHCFEVKDSAAFYSLFHEDPVVWVGITKENTLMKYRKKNPKEPDFFSDSYQTFYSSITPQEKEAEKFYNLVIHHDECIASVTFDYSFWKNGKPLNWGKESWALIKVNGQWKITSVVFSYEEENVRKEKKGMALKGDEEAELRKVIDEFADCMVKKDSARFCKLFHEDPVTWVGVYKAKSYAKKLEKDSALSQWYSNGYRSFAHSLTKKNPVEEKFENINITYDENLAAITFDYSYWAAGTKRNWGKESWILIKTNGQWKITSVIYSVEYESVTPEPRR